MLLKLKFANKGLGTVNINDIFFIQNGWFSLVFNYFIKGNLTPCIPYNYTLTTASKHLNYKKTNSLIPRHRTSESYFCCFSLPFNHSPTGHVITGYVKKEIKDHNFKSKQE